MSRTRRVVIAMIVCLCAAINARAQAPAPEGWVVLPVDEYRALRARANPETPPPTPPPVDATLTRVEYDLRVDPSTSLGAGGDTIAGRVMLTVDVLRDGWVKVPIPAGLMVRDARLDGQPVALIEGPPAHVVLSRTGPRRALARHLAAARCGGRHRIDHAAVIARAGVARDPDAAKGGVDLTVTGGFVSERSESATESRWTALGRANQPLGFSWKRKVDDRRADMALRFRARVASRSVSAKKCRRFRRSCASKCSRASRAKSRSRLPPGLVVNQVNGATVADWEVEGRTAARAPARSGRDRAVVRGPGREPAARRRRHQRAAGSRSGRRARNRRRRDQRARRRRDRKAPDARARAGRRRGPSPTSRPGANRHQRWRSACGPRRRRSAVADSLRQALHAASGADRQRRGGALSRARRGRWTCCSSKRTTRCATTSAAS